MELGLVGNAIVSSAAALCGEIAALDDAERMAVINEVRKQLHAISPMRDEPVDCVLWVPAETVTANDYNPNSVAPPEMRLLERSIEADGYTQPIVTFPENGGLTVIDGYHRNRVGRECKAIRKRIQGLLPVTIINPDRQDRGDRIAATIRHNRARGKHRVDAMSDIVVELTRRKWSDERIAKELGMEPDEVLRLKQVTGLAELFSDRDFSEAWE